MTGKVPEDSRKAAGGKCGESLGGWLGGDTGWWGWWDHVSLEVGGQEGVP